MPPIFQVNALPFFKNILFGPSYQHGNGTVPRSTCTARPATTSWKKCTFGSGCTGTPVRNLGLERVVRSILVDCSNAEYGCRTEKIAYCDRVEHELLRCRQHAPWREMPRLRLRW
ncbi:hypothetical protein HU200_002014 [Digitaria exilis]|uniref:Uncharacterized protein n=1 Tax=Digitaria exilis TaxID=1010633 RepID=A0A835FXX2_9POAL|nr:hypothetical protein HU200_002014 [Digitaria exilis]